jgi:trehalose-phosphatase
VAGVADHESGRIDAVVFDTDGVVTKTAAVHSAAWKQLFDAELTRRAAEGGPPVAAFTGEDYRRYVDGKPREDGVASFLASRDIELPWGEPDDPPGRVTVHALGNAKNDAFLARMRADGVEPFADTRAFVERLRAAGVRTAVISASKNCAEILEVAGVADLFEVRVDGLDAQALGLPGKPDPAIFLEAARRLDVEPARTAIVEDAVSGVAAGRRGGFALVIGVDRVGHPDVVVADLHELIVTEEHTIERDDHPRSPLPSLPSALTDDDLPRLLEGRAPAVFLDYDGTLTPIVARPELALLPDTTRAVLEALAARTTVGIISGRDLDDVRSMVGGDERLWYAGSHGFDIASPEGWRRDIEAGRAVLPALDAAEARLRATVGDVTEAWVERKRFAIAVHYRQTPDDEVPRLEALVADVGAASDDLRMAGGKKIFELRPAIAWDKGRALHHIMTAAGIEPTTSLAVYVGDDVTDEDAFDAIRGIGVGVVVGTEDRATAARYRLDDTDQVRDLLQLLLDHLEGDP